MSIFIAQLFKKERGKQRLDERCTYLLPRQPKSSNWFSFKNSEIAIFYFNAALDRPPFIVNKSEIVLCHGYGEDGLEERVRRNFIDGKYLGLIDFPEAFCAVRVHDHGIEFAGSAVGADPLFYYENESVVVVTNRHNLLSLWVDSLTLRKEGVAWMIGRGHIGDFGTCWENICKTKPGAFYGFEKESSRIVESDYSSLFDPIDDGEIFKQVKEVSRCFRDILDKSESPCRFWLSGGKDSRAIAGLISEASRFPELTFQTHGEKFAPDVMAATSVARELGVLGRYTTSRSSLTEPTIDLTSALARDLLSDCTGGSLADFRTIPDSDLLIFGGHESGYKTPPNRLDLEAYLDSRKYWPDNQQILDRDFYNQLFAKFRNGLGALLASAPKSRYPQLEALVYVIPESVFA